MANYHVIKDKSSGNWKAKRAGASRASVIANTQAEAEKMAKKICANNGGGEVRIHRPDGSIRDSDTVSPGNDPRSSIDTKF